MAITFVGVGALAGDSVATNTITYAWPSGYTAVAGDVAIIIEGGWAGVATAPPNPPTGFTTIGTASRQPTTGNYIVITALRDVLTAGQAAPTRTVPNGASWASTGATWGVAGYVMVFRGVNQTTPIDATATTGSSAPAATFTAPAITTATANALVISNVITGDDNALNFNTANGFSLRASGGAYDDTIFEDFSYGSASFIKATAGATTMPIWNQSVNGNDSWAGLTIALRAATVPGTPTGLTVTNNRNNTYSLSWTAPSNGGDPIDDYLIRYKLAADAGYTSYTDSVSTSTSATVSGLSTAKEYFFDVAAVNGIGTGAYSADVSAAAYQQYFGILNLI